MYKYSLIVILSFFCIQNAASAQPLYCKVTNTVTDPHGFSTIASKFGTLFDNDSIVTIEAGTRPDTNMRMIGELSRESDGSISLHLGDFCGYVYTETTYQTDSKTLNASLSYGPDVKGYWLRLDMNCKTEVSTSLSHAFSEDPSQDADLSSQKQCSCGGDWTPTKRSQCIRICMASHRTVLSME